MSRLQQQIPARIDRSYWGETLSGSTGTQLMAALRFLRLIDTNSRPTPLLKQLVAARAEQRSELFREALRRYMEEQEWKEITRYGRMKAKERGITEDQVEDIVDAYRK